MILSVIVPTVPGREDALSRCLFYLGSHPAAEVVVVDGPGKMGDKICEGLGRASGDWAVVVDDDDTVRGDFIDTIVRETWADPDAIGYRMLITVDHRFGRVVNMRHSGHLPPWHELDPALDWSLLPKCVWRTEYGLQLGFGNHYTADQDFALGLAELVEAAAFIPQVLYHYDKRTREFGAPTSGYGQWPRV